MNNNIVGILVIKINKNNNKLQMIFKITLITIN